MVQLRNCAITSPFFSLYFPLSLKLVSRRSHRRKLLLAELRGDDVDFPSVMVEMLCSMLKVLRVVVIGSVVETNVPSNFAQ